MYLLIASGGEGLCHVLYIDLSYYVFIECKPYIKRVLTPFNHCILPEIQVLHVIIVLTTISRDL